LRLKTTSPGSSGAGGSDGAGSSGRGGCGSGLHLVPDCRHIRFHQGELRVLLELLATRTPTPTASYFRPVCVCVFLCVAPLFIVHSHTPLISTSFSSLRSHCSQPFASHRTSMMARRLAFTLHGWVDTQWDKAVSGRARSCAQAKEITQCFPLSLSRAAHIHLVCVLQSPPLRGAELRAP
jgi:hypothetical protein